MTPSPRNIHRALESLCFGLGAIGLLLFGGATLHGSIASAAALNAIEDRLIDEAEPAVGDPRSAAAAGAPLAVLTVERLGLQVPVFLGTDPVTLNKGAGIVDGTAVPGEVGNIAVAGHRDSYFRALENIKVGDLIDLRATHGGGQFRVSEIKITDPLDVSVLDDTKEVTLTLITCYPFRFVGFAPDRYIVRAVPVHEA